MTTLPIRVLVIEEHSFQRSISVNTLKQMGCHEVLEAAGGVQAMAVLQRQGRVDVALFDMRMESMDGLDFLQYLALSGLVGAIILSSSLPDELYRAAKQISSLHGITLLGDAGKPIQETNLRFLLETELKKPVESISAVMGREKVTDLELRDALARRHIHAYYQPKLCLRTGEVRGVEVFSRWQHPSRGLLSPVMFLPEMDSGGLLDELLFQQLQDGLSLQRSAWEKGYSLNIAFNLQASQLVNEDLALHIRSALAARGHPCSGVTFELTESGLLEAPATSMETLLRLRMMGCSLSIDDFGSGFSSLQRLCRLPFDEIKLDAEFVRSVGHESRCRAVVSSTLALGKALSMSVVVEGIETLEQHQALLDFGCIHGQGYLYARPMSADDFLAWLDQHYRFEGGVFADLLPAPGEVRES